MRRRRIFAQAGQASRAFAALLALVVSLSVTGVGASAASAAVTDRTHVSAVSDHRALARDQAAQAYDCDGIAPHDDFAAHGGSCCQMSCHAALMVELEAVQPSYALPELAATAAKMSSARIATIDRPPRFH